jgi:drug/metabolite transporter (DMT)-like permease
MDLSSFLMILLSATIHASWNFFTKKSLANKIVTLWFGWLIAGAIMTPVSLLFTQTESISSDWVPYIVLTTFVHAMYVYLLGWSYTLGEMSLAYPIARGIGVLFTVIIVVFTGMEVVSPNGVLGIFALVLGIVLIAIKRIRDLEKRNAMKVAALVGCCTAFYTIIDKISITYIPPFFYISVMFLCTSLSLLPIMLLRLRTHTLVVFRSHKRYCAMIGLLSLFAYLLILFALQKSPTPYVAAVREISIVFGSILGICYLKEERNKRKLIGIATILLGAIIIKTA